MEIPIMAASLVKKRFLDPGLTLYSLMDEIWIECPRCKTRARITPLEVGQRDWFAPRRLTCLHCGYTRDWAEREIRRGWRSQPAVDDFFHQPLWFQAPFGDKVLWAYNLRHLALIESYVAADLRTHRRRSDFGWQNSSLVNRLPRWISDAKHRDAILDLIQKLRAR